MIYGQLVTSFWNHWIGFLYTCGFQSEVPEPAASTTSGNLLNIQILESKALGMGPNILCFNKPSR